MRVGRGGARGPWRRGWLSVFFFIVFFSFFAVLSGEASENTEETKVADSSRDAGERPGNSRAGAEARAIHSLGVSLDFDAMEIRSDSPFGRLADKSGWSLGSALGVSYGLRFIAPGISAQLALNAQAAAPDDFEYSISQAWVKASLGEGWALKFGRFELNWKDGGYWNPSDLVNLKAAWASDAPIAGRDALEIIGLLSLGSVNIDIGAASFLTERIDSPARLPLYLSAGSLLYPFELRLKAGLPPGIFLGEAKPVFGASLKYSLGDFNVYADIGLLQDSSIAADFGHDSPRKIWSRWTLGADGIFGLRSALAKSLAFRLAYLRQDDGLSGGQARDYLASLNAIALYDGDGLADPLALAAYAEACATWEGRFFSLYRDYLALSLSLDGISQRDISASLSSVINVEEGSLALLSALSWSPLKRFRLSLSAQHYLGPAGGEARALPQSQVYKLSLSRAL